MICPVCDAPLLNGIRVWHFECTHCRYEGSSLVPNIVDHAPDDVDEALREEGLSALRQANFHLLAGQLRALVRTPEHARPRLLDVGCAHGWFIDATAADFDAIGIEPDEAIADASLARGLRVRKGFFPDVVNPGELFDVISFNDVLEHIPDVNGALASCVEHLSPEGTVMVNAPSRRGALYLVSKLLARMGFGGPFDRLWQKDFPSPHVHYLDASTVGLLASRHGLKLIRRTTLPAISSRGLYARVKLSRNVSVAKAVGLTLVLGAVAPVLKFLPADIEVWYLKRR